MEQFDIIVIGFGKGGKTLAADLAAEGKTVALVERSSKMYGGTCINVGCIPTKSLVHSAQKAAVLAYTDFQEKATFYKDAVLEKRRLVEMLRKKNYTKLADHPNITIYNGQGFLLSDHLVGVVTEGGQRELYGETIILNTGSHSVLPPIQGLNESKFTYTSDSILELEELPAHLIIVGGGYIGLEFASFYSDFGAKVTVLIRDSLFMPKEDQDISAQVQAVFEKRGVSFVFEAGVEGIEDKDGQVTVSYTLGGEKKSITGNAVLVATGRKPNTEELRLENAGLETLPRGGIKTDSLCRTSCPNIFAVGDVKGGLLFTYVSLDDSRKVKAALSGKEHTGSSIVPYSVFIEPPFSRVGLSEAQAREQGFDIKVFQLSAAAIPKAHVLQSPVGMLKAVVDARTDQILGASLFCEESHELINLIKLAMDLHAPYTCLRDNVFTHPTMGEALNDLFASPR